MKTLLAAAVAAVSLLCATEAAAKGIAHFLTDGPITWTQSGFDTGGTLTGSGNAALNFYPSAFGEPVNPLSSMWLDATFTLTGFAPQGSVVTICSAVTCIQPGATFSFSVIYTGEEITAGGKTISNGANLLTGTGLSGQLIASSGGGVAPLALASGSYSSDVIGNVAEIYNSFVFNVPAGSFTAQPGESASPFTTYEGRGIAWTSVPEPATWAMMIAGFGMVGTVVRRESRRRSQGEPLAS